MAGGAFRILRFAGIDVLLHWSWFLIVVIAFEWRARLYGSPVWSILECLALFGIVLLHELGHALACRQVGGQANRIVLWPLGGRAYVNPPRRPGATLWTIAAGPLVNVALAPIFTGLLLLSGWLAWASSMPDLYRFVYSVWLVNLALLVVNMLPIYPLDGGQILRSLLWFVVGQASSLLIASSVGLVGVTALLALAFWKRDIWLAIPGLFILMNCRSGFLQALALLRLSRAPGDVPSVVEIQRRLE